MWQRARALLSSTISSGRKKLRDRAGSSPLIWGAFLMVAMTLIFTAFFQRDLLNNKLDVIQKDIGASLIETASSHLYDSQQPIRDGTSSANRNQGSGYTEITNPRKFLQLFCRMFPQCGLDGNNIVKIDTDGTLEFRLSAIRLWVQNPQPGSVEATYKISYKLEIPMDFVWREKAITLTNQIQYSRYEELF